MRIIWYLGVGHFIALVLLYKNILCKSSPINIIEMQGDQLSWIGEYIGEYVMSSSQIHITTSAFKALYISKRILKSILSFMEPVQIDNDISACICTIEWWHELHDLINAFEVGLWVPWECWTLSYCSNPSGMLWWHSGNFDNGQSGYFHILPVENQLKFINSNNLETWSFRLHVDSAIMLRFLDIIIHVRDASSNSENFLLIYNTYGQYLYRTIALKMFCVNIIIDDITYHFLVLHTCKDIVINEEEKIIFKRKFTGNAQLPT